MKMITIVYDISPDSLKTIRMYSYLHSHNPDLLSKYIVIIMHLSTFFFTNFQFSHHQIICKSIHLYFVSMFYYPLLFAQYFYSDL